MANIDKVLMSCQHTHTHTKSKAISQVFRLVFLSINCFPCTFFVVDQYPKDTKSHAVRTDNSKQAIADREFPWHKKEKFYLSFFPTWLAYAGKQYLMEPRAKQEQYVHLWFTVSSRYYDPISIQNTRLVQEIFKNYYKSFSSTTAFDMEKWKVFKQ